MFMIGMSNQGFGGYNQMGGQQPGMMDSSMNNMGQPQQGNFNQPFQGQPPQHMNMGNQQPGYMGQQQTQQNFGSNTQ